MELEFQSPIKSDSFINEPQLKAKTAHRIHYEAQVEVIKKQCGNLEEIRHQLSLSQRKISQLLMVDPSAWTRWTKKDGDEAPPHVYRALQWYMTLLEKIPGLTPQYFIGKNSEVINEKLSDKLALRISELEQKNQSLNLLNEALENKIGLLGTQVQANRAGFYMLVLATLIMAGAFVWFFRKL